MPPRKTVPTRNLLESLNVSTLTDLKSWLNNSMQDYSLRFTVKTAVASWIAAQAARGHTDILIEAGVVSMNRNGATTREFEITISANEGRESVRLNMPKPFTPNSNGFYIVTDCIISALAAGEPIPYLDRDFFS